MDLRILSYYVEKFSMDTTIIIGLDVKNIQPVHLITVIIFTVY